MTTTSPKLIALDLDGTLLRSDGSMSKRSRTALDTLKRQGVTLVICTGRPERTARAVLEQLEPDLAAIYNGAVVLDVRQNCCLKQFGMPKALALEAIRRMKVRFPEAMAGIETNHGWYVEAAYAGYRQLRSERVLEPTGVGELGGFMRESVIKLLFRHPSLSSDVLQEALLDLPVHNTWSFPSLLEVSAEGVTKENALNWLSHRLGLKASEVAAFGDQHNDKEMLAWAGHGVAMGNAAPEAKAAADEITLSNDEDGVARVLERWIEGRD